MANKNIERWRAREPRGEASEATYWGLFEYQSTNWAAMAKSHLHAVWDITTRFISIALDDCVEKDILPLLREHMIDKRLDKLRNSVHSKLNDLLRCHGHGNPGFYDGFVDVFTLKEQTKVLAERLVSAVLAT
jgi:hypothetical protein